MTFSYIIYILVKSGSKRLSVIADGKQNNSGKAEVDT